tara:strand:- start:68 stop:793 length:726 start_codon:yes stop_codon:yes gene_type:complete
MNVLVEFSIKKKSRKEDENEDAYALNHEKDVFAIADGVSTSPASKLWSKFIVEKFIESSENLKEPNSIYSWLENVQKESLPEFQKYSSEKIKSEFIKDRLEEEGTATTFLGGKIDRKEGKKLHVYAVGDSNMFILRKNRIIDSFPIDLSGTYSDSTHAIFSIKKNDGNESFSSKTFQLIKNDIIILATDALAKWITDSSNLGQKPWNKILKNKNSTEKFIEELRTKNKIDDDDTTCMILQI